MLENLANTLLAVSLINLAITPMTPNPRKYAFWDLLCVTLACITWVIVNWKG